MDSGSSGSSESGIRACSGFGFETRLTDVSRRRVGTRIVACGVLTLRLDVPSPGIGWVVLLCRPTAGFKLGRVPVRPVHGYSRSIGPDRVLAIGHRPARQPPVPV